MPSSPGTRMWLVPLVLAAEAAYLGFIGTHPRFQRHVDAQEHKAARAQADAEAVERLNERLFRPRSSAASRRSRTAASRCGRSPSSCASPTAPSAMRSLDELQLSDLDRLLWIYLRTLVHAAHARAVLSEHQRRPDPDRDPAPGGSDSPDWKRSPTRPTGAESANRFRPISRPCKSRLSNLEKAKENYELLQAEIENLETKIQSITELAINRSDAEAITGQVEQITQGLVRTEQTINDLGLRHRRRVVRSDGPDHPLSRGRSVPTTSSSEPPPRRANVKTKSVSFEAASGQGCRMARGRRSLILGINCAYHESAAALVR